MDAISVGIDVSKGKSVVMAMRFPRAVVFQPREIDHSAAGLKQLVALVKKLDGESRVTMESTGHYHIPVASALHEAGIFVSVVTPMLIRRFADVSLRQAKTDRQDSITIARYGLKYWDELRAFSPLDITRQRLRDCSRQYHLYVDVKIRLKNNLVALLDQSFPGSNSFFIGPPKADGHEKWVDFAEKFWHCECVCNMSEKAFVEEYSEWCKHHDYCFNRDKALLVYEKSQGLAPCLPKNAYTEFRIQDIAKRISNISHGVEIYRAEILRLAQRLPEYPVVKKMFGMGKTFGPLLIAEIGDVRRFTHKKALVAFAGIDPGSEQSGKYINKNSVAITRSGNEKLRSVICRVAICYVRSKKKDEPVYQFYLKKRSEGKDYYLSIVAAANKLLRIYYAKVTAYLDELDDPIEKIPSPC